MYELIITILSFLPTHANGYNPVNMLENEGIVDEEHVIA